MAEKKRLLVKYDSPEAFAETQLQLLAIEREAEVEQTRDLLSCGGGEVQQINKKVTRFFFANLIEWFSQF